MAGCIAARPASCGRTTSLHIKCMFADPSPIPSCSNKVRTVEYRTFIIVSVVAGVGAQGSRSLIIGRRSFVNGGWSSAPMTNDH
jgi:hypothetical protein